MWKREMGNPTVTKIVLVFLLAYPAYVGLGAARAFLLSPHEETKDAGVRSYISEIYAAVEQFRFDCGRYPTDTEGLAALEVRPKKLSGWHGPYIREGVHDDNTGQPYQYHRLGDRFTITGHSGMPVDDDLITVGSEQ